MFNRIVAIICMMLSLGQFSFDAGIDEINLGGNLFLVNRTYKLDMRYVPEDLVMPSVLSTSDEVLMREEAADALEKLFSAAQMEQGYVLHAISGYRSYHTQKTIYNRKINRVGSVKRAQKYVAPPGASEHQLGLAMDIGTPNRAGLNEGFGETKEGIWTNEMGVKVSEGTLVCCFSGTKEEVIQQIIADVRKELNQESVLEETRQVHYSFVGD